MNILKTGWIILMFIAVTLFGYGYRIYKRQSNTLERYEQNIKLIEGHKGQNDLSIERELEEKENIKTLKKLAQERESWWFLQDIEENLGEKIKPMFRFIGPLEATDEGDYVRLSRALEVSTTYPELIKLLTELEKERGFMVEKLRVIKNQEDIERHLAYFVLSTIEIKESFFEQLRQLGADTGTAGQMVLVSESLIVDPIWQEGEKLVLKEDAVDPFISYRDRKTIIARYPVVAEEAVMVPIDVSSKYRLEGIIRFPKYMTALVSPNHILREGDWLDTMQVISITPQKITFMEGQQEYYIVNTQEAGVKPGMASDFISIQSDSIKSNGFEFEEDSALISDVIGTGDGNE